VAGEHAAERGDAEPTPVRSNEGGDPCLFVRVSLRDECRSSWLAATFKDYASFTRVAGTEDQIADRDLPARPTKKSDTRSKGFEGDSVELDAIPLDRLRQLARDCIEQHVDQHQLSVLQKTEDEERRLLLEMAETFNGGPS
jgi:hypothetical protein